MRHVEAYQNGEDNGWLHKQNYWFDPNHEHGFGIVDLDSIYPSDYFKNDHVQPHVVKNYVDMVIGYFKSTTGKNLDSVIEFGCAGGWFLEEFIKRGYNIRAFEGTAAGIDRCKKRGVDVVNRVRLHDMRHGYKPAFKMDIALCTEVAEHIEPPFSATLVQSLTKSANWIWFSSEEPNTNPAHIHHPNEMPDIFWINLFDFYGFGCFKLPDAVGAMTEGRGKYIFYNRSVYDSSQFLQ